MTSPHSKQLVAPEGFHTLEKGKLYHLLHNDSIRGRVLLVHLFSERGHHKKKQRDRPTVEDRHRARLLVVARSDFEDALHGGLVVSAPFERAFPPWLEQLEGKSIAYLDARRRKKTATPKKSNEERAHKVASVIRALLDDSRSAILSADNPMAELRSHA